MPGRTTRVSAVRLTTIIGVTMLALATGLALRLL
jgi:hypothetical protein